MASRSLLIRVAVTYLYSARDRLAKAMQAYFHSTEGLIYLFSEASQANSSSGQSENL